MLYPATKSPHLPSVFPVKALSRCKGLESGGNCPVTSPFPDAELLLGIVDPPSPESLPCIQVVTDSSAQWNASRRVDCHLNWRGQWSCRWMPGPGVGWTTRDTRGAQRVGGTLVSLLEEWACLPKFISLHACILLSINHT